MGNVKNNKVEEKLLINDLSEYIDNINKKTTLEYNNKNLISKDINKKSNIKNIFNNSRDKNNIETNNVLSLNNLTKTIFSKLNIYNNNNILINSLLVSNLVKLNRIDPIHINFFENYDIMKNSDIKKMFDINEKNLYYSFYVNFFNLNSIKNLQLENINIILDDLTNLSPNTNKISVSNIDYLNTILANNQTSNNLSYISNYSNIFDNKHNIKSLNKSKLIQLSKQIKQESKQNCIINNDNNFSNIIKNNKQVNYPSENDVDYKTIHNTNLTDKSIHK